jgi:hypothetical protein
MFEENKVLFRSSDYGGMELDRNTAKSVLQLAISSSTPSAALASNEQADDLSSLLDAAQVNDEQADKLLTNNDTAGLNTIALLMADADKPFDVSADADPQSELGTESLTITAVEFKAELGEFIRSENIETREIDYTETCSQLLAVNAVHRVEATLNLLQGEFSPISANAANRQFMRNAGAIVSACVALFLIVTLAGGFYLNYKADSYFDDSVAIYRSVFPKQKKVIDPVKQMQRQLTGKAVGGTTSDFLPLLDAASRALSNLETEVPSTIGQLRYDNQRGHIIIDLRVNNIDILESYKEQLSAEGLNVDILSANQDQDRVNGRMQISR